MKGNRKTRRRKSPKTPGETVASDSLSSQATGNADPVPSSTSPPPTGAEQVELRDTELVTQLKTSEVDSPCSPVRTQSSRRGADASRPRAVGKRRVKEPAQTRGPPSAPPGAPSGAPAAKCRRGRKQKAREDTAAPTAKRSRPGGELETLASSSQAPVLLQSPVGAQRNQEMTYVSHLHASQLLHNKFVVVLGDSIQRSVYKDLVLLLQKEKFLSIRQLKRKGEACFEQDCLVEGGSLGTLTNGTGYREVRQFRSDHYLVRFYFVTRVYSPYMRSILEEFRNGLKPDVIVFNSCVWDISRYKSKWLAQYRENLHSLFSELREAVPPETLAIWNLTMPLGKTIRGGFLVPEIQHKAPHLRADVIEANFFSGTLAAVYGLDVLDLHYQFRFSLQHRAKDGVHWNAVAHRHITSLLLEHCAEAWGVALPAVDRSRPLGSGAPCQAPEEEVEEEVEQVEAED